MGPDLMRWIEPSITGARRVLVDGVSFSVPEDAELQLVKSSRMDFLHVRIHRSRVYVLSRYGQLDEDDAAAQSRATATNWRMVAGESVSKS